MGVDEAVGLADDACPVALTVGCACPVVGAAGVGCCSGVGESEADEAGTDGCADGCADCVAVGDCWAVGAAAGDAEVEVGEACCGDGD